MKKTVQFLILIFLSVSVFGQTFPSLRFRKPTTSDGTTFKFTAVSSGVDAYVTIIGTKNASLDKIDDSSNYVNAWQPKIKISSNAGSTDSSYVEFGISFVKAGTMTPHSFNNMAMTVVDLDGNGFNSYREMVKSSLPATPVGIVGTAITTVTDANNLTLIAGIIDYSPTDTTNYGAMTQINYTNVSTYTLKVGVYGNINGNTIRQFSFYFKPFKSMTFVLPVRMINFKVGSNNEVPEVKWTTTSEENCKHFEVYRSLDGVNYTLEGQVTANGNSQTLSHYSFSDQALFGQVITNVFYKLRIVDYNGEYTWSTVLHFNKAVNSNQTVIGSVYPNPSQGILNINFKTISENNYTIEVVDVFGKVFRTLDQNDINGMSQITLDLNDLNTGLYFVNVTEANGSNNTIKFLKN